VNPKEERDAGTFRATYAAGVSKARDGSAGTGIAARLSRKTNLEVFLSAKRERTLMDPASAVHSPSSLIYIGDGGDWAARHRRHLLLSARAGGPRVRDDCCEDGEANATQPQCAVREQGRAMDGQAD
jgi:hypothetical protein